MLTVIVKEGGKPVTLNLDQDVITLGRSRESVIVIKNIKASRNHARIERVGATYQITDLGSGNGTRINGKKIDFHALSLGDEIRIGDATIMLQSIDDGPDAMEAKDDVVEEELKIADDEKLELIDDRDTERMAISEAETEFQAPSVPVKPEPRGIPSKNAGKPLLGGKKPGAPIKPPGKR